MMTAPGPQVWSARGLARAAGIAAFAASVGAGMGYLIAHEPVPHTGKEEETRPPRPPPAGDAELALLAPLREGGALGDFAVTEIDAVGADGLLHLVCTKASAKVKLDVALKAEGGPAPPALAGRYAVFYATEGASSAEGDALARALAAILEANAASPAPPKMAPFVPHR